MKRQISSDASVFWKYIFPGLVIFVVGLGAIAVGLQEKRPPGWTLFMLGWILSAVYIIWFARRLKSVSIDDDYLYVSQLRKEIQIPLTHIQQVKENYWTNPKLITLKLNHPSEFGTKIVFTPATRAFTAFRSHPIVPEIESAIRRRRSRR